MKLVEILARDIAYWPDRIEAMDQCAMGEIIEAGNSSRVFFVAQKANDREIVTRAQWEAERARILLESRPERDPLIKEITSGASFGYTMQCDFESEDVKKYEQELWDKVAASVAPTVYADAMSEFAKTGCPCEDWRDYVASDICQMADAFMAERAKRMKQ